MRLIDFGRRLAKDARVLLHCEAGVSRSTAAALVLLAGHMGPEKLDEAANRLIENRWEARPNSLILTYAEEILACPGLAAAGAGVSATYPGRLLEHEEQALHQRLSRSRSNERT